jgi:hypothetical protein
LRRRKGFNPKRKIRDDIDNEYLNGLSAAVRYGGNPEHKRNPGDFGLTPPANPRPDKSLCDIAQIFTRDAAIRHLRAGIDRGLISQDSENGYPKNIWAVTDDGIPLEAQLENKILCMYHGYPVSETDPFSEIILDRWNQA